MRRLVPVVLIILCVASACAGTQQKSTTDTATGPVVPGSVSRLKTSLRAMRGRPVVVNYWATWCDPCKKETPRLVDAANRYHGRVLFLGVDVEDDLASARRFARRYRMPYRSLALSKADVQQAQDILGLPVTQFYRADGELGFVHQGEIKADDLTRKIEELLKKS